MTNKHTFEHAGIVTEYAAAKGLQLPERTIFDALSDRLRTMRMLDIGVGGGRTTEHFAGLVKQYIGIDYSEPMIEVCRTRFSDQFPDARFEVGDATDMRSFDNASFDFILFSFNGIDYVTHEERLEAFRAVHRVGCAGAVFCFSTHNIQSIDRLNRFSDILRKNPIWTAKQIPRWLDWKRRYQKSLNLDESPVCSIRCHQRRCS